MKHANVRWVAAFGLWVGVAGCGDDSGSGSMGTTAASTSGVGTTGSDSGTTAGGSGEGTDAGTGGPVGPDPADELLRLAQARCNWLFTCCDRGELDYEVGPFTSDAGACAERLLRAAELSPSTPVSLGAAPLQQLLPLLASWNEGRVEVLPERITECVQALESEPCTPIPDEDFERCEPGDDVSGITPAACGVERLVAGQQQQGEPCRRLMGDAECAEGLRCAGTGQTGVCAVLADDTETCLADNDCAEGLICDLNNGAVCAAGLDDGAACSFTDPENPVPGTEVQRCGPGLLCNPDTEQCETATCALGAPCGTDLDCPDETLCSLGTCQGPLPAYAPCGRGFECQSGWCVTDGTFLPGGEIYRGPPVCHWDVPAPDGAECVSNFDCLSRFCDRSNNRCAQPRPVGAVCTDNSGCEESYCDPDAQLCTAYSGEGEACANRNQCEPGEGFECAGGVCRKLMDGEECIGSTFCLEGSTCFFDPDMSERTCRARAQLDEECGSGLVQCDLALYCLIEDDDEDGIGRCAPKKRAGEDCEEFAECFGSCIDRWGPERICGPGVPAGEAWCDGVG